MPYRRGYRSRRRKRFMGKKSAKSVAYRALKLAKKVNKREELKMVETAGTIVGPDSSGAIQNLSVVSQGNNNQNRQGDVISPTSLKLRLTASIHASATATQLRVILFKSKTTAITTVTQIINTAAINAFKAEDYRYISKILYDKVFQLDSVNRPEMFLHKYIKLGGIMGYPGSTTTPNRNGVSILLISDEAANVPLVAYTSRLHFKDA